MKRKPTNEDIAKALMKASVFFQQDNRQQAARWLRIAAKRIQLLDCQVRNAAAKEKFLSAMEAERERKVKS